jgi:hypothetical protein
MVEETVTWSDRLILAPIGASVPAARGFIQDLLIDHDLLYLVEDVRLVTSELATNATRHARTSFTVLLEGLDHSIRLTVTHDCAARPVLTTIPVMATAGRGLNIVGYYSQDWGVSEGKRYAKSVWASFDLHPAPVRRYNFLPGGDQPAGTEHIESRADAPIPNLPTQSRLLLSPLLHDVKDARVSLGAARARGGVEIIRVAQERLVASLKLYVDMLETRRLPVPYQLRDELRLYRRTLAASSAARPGGW